MTNDTRTTDEIERDIANERAQMSDALNDLQDKFSIGTVVNDIGDMIRDQGGELGQKVGQTVRRNPAAVALVTVGVAWLFLGTDRSKPANGSDRQPPQYFGRREKWAGSARHDSHASPYNRRDTDDDPSWYGGGGSATEHRSNGRNVGRDGQKTDSTNEDKGVSGKARNAVGNVAASLSGVAEGWGDTASDLTARLSQGLEDLSEEAKSRVMSARRAAHEAKQTSQAGVRRAVNFFEDQPLVAGALAIAVGAAFGAMLPHSKFEDDTMGASRDQLFAEAEKVFREERDKAMLAARKAGKSIASEVRSDVEEMGSTLGDLLPEGKSASDVVTDHMSESAERLLASASGRSQQKDANRNDT